MQLAESVKWIPSWAWSFHSSVAWGLPVFLVSILVQVEFERKVSLGEVIHVMSKLWQGRPSHWICRSKLGNSFILLCLILTSGKWCLTSPIYKHKWNLKPLPQGTLKFFWQNIYLCGMVTIIPLVKSFGCCSLSGGTRYSAALMSESELRNTM